MLRIEELAVDPRPAGCKKLKGDLSTYYRVCYGIYRVIYSVNEEKIEVLVVKVSHRKDIYR